MTEISALVIGLGPSCAAKYNFANVDLPDLWAKLELAGKKLREHPSISSRLYYLDIDDAADVAKVKHLIRTGDPERGGRPWHAVCFGYGLRGSRELTPRFEELVNHVKDEAPAARITFSADVLDFVVVFGRHFPHLLGQQ